FDKEPEVGSTSAVRIAFGGAEVQKEELCTRPRTEGREEMHGTIAVSFLRERHTKDSFVEASRVVEVLDPDIHLTDAACDGFRHADPLLDASIRCGDHAGDLATSRDEFIPMRHEGSAYCVIVVTHVEDVADRVDRHVNRPECPDQPRRRNLRETVSA